MMTFTDRVALITGAGGGLGRAYAEYLAARGATVIVNICGSTLDEYVEGLGAWVTGRFVRDMLGDAGWRSFLDRAHARFRERFADPVNDFRRVLLAVATRP